MKVRRLFVPEVVQTSAMDCGPACLKSVLEAHGVHVSYDRLRETCQTSLDGTSIDTIEQVANQLGLDAEQIIIPVDHVLLPEADINPAILVVRLPNSFTHFVVLWRKHGGVLQVMDPAAGRLWPRTKGFLDQVYVHHHVVPAQAWRAWAGSEDFCRALTHRALILGVPRKTVSRLVQAAAETPCWQSLAILDAAVRMLTPVAQAGGLSGSRTAARVLTRCFENAMAKGDDVFQAIPPAYWSVLPGGADEAGDEQVVFQGAVAVRVRHRRKVERRLLGEIAPEPAGAPPDEINATLSASSARPLRHIFKVMREDGLLKPTAIFAGLGLSTCAVLFEALLYRTFVDLSRFVAIPQQRQVTVAILAAFFIGLLILDLCITRDVLRLGRNLEIRLRTHILEKLPRLADHYLSSRLISDLAERAHSIQEIRGVPAIGTQLMLRIFELVLTTAGVIWLDPRTLWPAISCAVVAVILPLFAQPIAAERDLRFRTHSGALCRFYFDALRGLMPIWTHRADHALRIEHESLLVNWLRAALSLQRTSVTLGGLSGLIGFALTIWLLMAHFRGGDLTVSLLLVYWALNLPVIGGQLASIVLQYPRQRNLVLRILEPLSAPEERSENTTATLSPEPISRHASPALCDRQGLSIRFESVTVGAMGHSILSDLNLEIDAGSHVCIVGPSGAGKSTLVGILLGWHRPTSGQIFIDGELLHQDGLEALRQETVWVDPSIQIWNRSLLQNLQFGEGATDSLRRIGEVVEQADLIPLLKKLPKGLQTRLGEGGGLVSGGEGQRVRLGRAMLRRSPRLVILDEPFSALDREQRQELMRLVRRLWRDATLLCITHDVSESVEFERVLVVDKGQIVQSGAPSQLLQQSGSRYEQLLQADQAVHQQVWSKAAWRWIRLERGQISESGKQGYDRRFSKDLLAEDAFRRSAPDFSPEVVPSSERS
jgi:ABC-type bacteriocin/lantibiotic exporter with double-glycine peptidase domain